jgi:hypothetical protein
MNVAARKLPIENMEALQALVIENLDGVEPNLTALDTRLLLGQATIDVIARDGSGALVLIALSFTADEALLLRAVEAYSWCLEYPDAIHRLYPGARVSEAEPPRVIFVIERMPEAFQRKVKQLGFAHVDCVEFRHFEVNGAPVAYFESLARFRRPALQPVAERQAPPTPVAPVRNAAAENVIPMSAAPARATSVKLQKLLHQPAEAAPARPAAPVAAPVVVNRAPAPAPRAVEPRPAPRPVEAAPAPRPVEAAPAATPAPTVAAAAEVEPVARVSLREAAAALLQAAPAPATAPVATAPVAVAEVDERRVSFSDLARELLGRVPAPAAPAPAPVIEPPTVDEISHAEPEAAIAEPAVDLPAAPAEEPVAAEAPAAAIETAPAVEPKAPAPTPAQDSGRPGLPSLPKGFEGLNFPNDGALTRQWMEFLNQMAATR